MREDYLLGVGPKRMIAVKKESGYYISVMRWNLGFLSHLYGIHSLKFGRWFAGPAGGI